MYKHLIPDSIVESIPACRARDPGSIPGQGVPFFLYEGLVQNFNYGCGLGSGLQKHGI